MKSAFASPPKGTSRRAAALVLMAHLGGCGGADAPNTPSSPSPGASVSPSPQAGGALAGPYTLELRPSAACGMGGPVTFPMAASAAAPAGAGPYPGVQILVAGEVETLELEVLATASGINGGFGTTERGALSNEAVRVWINAIGSGAVTRAADGRGQILSGRLTGYIAFGHAAGPEASLGSCTSVDHAYTLRTR